MKKIINYFLAFMLIANVASAETEVPHHVMDAFKLTNVEADMITWSVVGSEYQVHYMINGAIENIKVYNDNDQVIRHEMALSSNEIPVEIASKFSASEKSNPTFKIWKVVDQNKTISYRSEVEGKNKIFNQKGDLQK